MSITAAAPPQQVPVFGGFDYVTVDAVHRRVYAAHGGSQALLIVDADTGKMSQVRVGPMHGVAFDPASGHVFTGNGDDKSISEVDPETKKVLRSVDLPGLIDAIARYGPRHLELVLGSLLLSTLIGVPLGIMAYVWPRPGSVILGLTGVVQTIPSLALFCFFIPVLGIGPVPALAALFLYGLLPIVRNTYTGLVSIPSELRDAARALGLSTVERLRHVELPLASRTILAGVKTSAVVAVGSATIAAFIGAGGFGEPISTGLSLNDVPTILQGALPAAGLALVVQGVFELIERALIPKGLRIQE